MDTGRNNSAQALDSDLKEHRYVRLMESWRSDRISRSCNEEKHASFLWKTANILGGVGVLPFPSDGPRGEHSAVQMIVPYADLITCKTAPGFLCLECGGWSTGRR